MYRRVLVAVDSTPAARGALNEVAEIAQWSGATVDVVTVVAPVSKFAWGAASSVAYLAAGAEHSAAEVIAAALVRLPQDVSVTTQIRHGSPGTEIVRAAEECRVELIVLGSRARGRATSSLFGGVGAYVHFHSPLPLMVIKASEEHGSLS